MSSLEQWILMTNLDMSALVDRPPLRQNNHDSDTDKMTTTKNSLTSTKISECLDLLDTLHKIKGLSTRNPRHNLSIVNNDQ